jgi:CHAT domain-containing protein
MQNNLGTAYTNRIRGDQAENLEIAIAAYTAAMKIHTRADFPQDWATAQNNLGEAYRKRIKGDQAENLERGIAAFSAALEIRTCIDFPQDWAITQNNLGNAYTNRIKGDQAENLEQATAVCSAALQIYTRTDSPQNWARTQNNLGNAYRKSIKGDQAENLERAIAAYTAALEIYTRVDFPQDWAMTQNNLGAAYSDRIRGDQTENLEQAIAAFSAALEIYTCTDFPQLWAMMQNNLGNAYTKRIRGGKAENLETAIMAYIGALKIYTRTDFPQDWARTQNNLGNVYRERIRGDQAENLEQAITACSAALEIRTRTNFPQDNLQTLYNLSLAYQNAEQFNLAYTSLADAIEGVESLREAIVSGDEVKRKQAEEWNGIYLKIVEVCLELGNTTAAIEYAERSKTRNLVESILNRDAKTFFPSEVVTQLEQLRDEIASGQYQIQNGKAENSQALAQHLQQLRQRRNDLQDQYLPVGSGFKFDSFQSNVAANTAIIEWYLTSEKITAFIIKSQGQEITVWQSQPEDLNALSDLIKKYLGDYYGQKDQWQSQLEERLNKLSEILHLDEILTHIPKHCDRLILIPHRLLHLLPLHTLPVKESYLLDLFPKGVGYAPSCQLLQQVQLRQRPNFQSLFAIQNPTEDLFFTDLEVDKILPLFSSHQVLPNKQATKAAILQASPTLKNINSLHFSCHGSFDPNSPQDSFLLLHGADNPELDLSKCLTLGNLFERDFDLSQCRLVTLSACETGLIEYTNASDEYIGLPSGFLYAGSVNVVSSLWTVDDLSTALLMIHFYQRLHTAWTSGQGERI